MDVLRAARSWVDYSVTIDASHIDENLMFEVEDLEPDTEGYRLDALSVHLFPQSIPSDRVARQVVTQAIDLVYSITIDSHHLHAYTYYFSIKCGAVPTTYKVRALAIHAEVSNGGTVHGLVCPEGHPLQKRTVFLSNSLMLVQPLAKLCKGKHKKPHRRIEGSVKGHRLSTWSQAWPKRMCSLIAG